jgi:hypothetical protein
MYSANMQIMSDLILIHFHSYHRFRQGIAWYSDSDHCIIRHMHLLLQSPFFIEPILIHHLHHSHPYQWSIHSYVFQEYLKFWIHYSDPFTHSSPQLDL